MADMKLIDIAEVLGCSKAAASMLRTGTYGRPGSELHVRYAALVKLLQKQRKKAPKPASQTSATTARVTTARAARGRNRVSAAQTTNAIHNQSPTHQEPTMAKTASKKIPSASEEVTEYETSTPVAKLQKRGAQGAAVIEAVQNKRAYLLRHGSEEQAKAPEKLVHQVLQAWQLLRKIEELQEQLEPMLEELRPKLLGQSLVIPGVCRLSVIATSTVGIKDPQKLMELLGDDFEHLVTEKVTYKPTEKLIEMSADGDDPMAPAYRALLTIKTGSSIKFAAER